MDNDNDSYSETDLLLLGTNPMDGLPSSKLLGANGTDSRTDAGRSSTLSTDDELLDIRTERYEALGYMNAEYDEETQPRFQTSKFLFFNL